MNTEQAAGGAAGGGEDDDDESDVLATRKKKKKKSTNRDATGATGEGDLQVNDHLYLQKILEKLPFFCLERSHCRYNWR